ncbi:hypothetical protein IKF03_00185 [Candidatus Saccharibacteria bacterium]|nr:hypothetical protein [Candidatus Saccharibacteria bacterium]
MPNKNLKVSYIPYVPDEMNDVAFSSKFNQRWTNALKDMIEKDGGTIHTYDITPFEEADAILSFDNVYFQNNKFFKALYNCDKLGATTHIDFEPPSASCKIHNNAGLKKLSHLFKSLITYNDSVINGDTIVKGVIGDFYTKELPYKNDFKKRKLVAIIANNRDDVMDEVGRHPDELYSQRKVAADYFQKKCPSQFDLYGNYWPNSFKRCLRGPIKREEKTNVISKYRFLISYDSITNQKGYISEKIFDCFKAKTVPVYWGADNVTEYIPENCFIDKRNFKTYDELYDFLKNMSEEEYEKYIKNIENYLKSSLFKKLFSSQASAKIIYRELTRPKRRINKIRAKKIINAFEEKRWSAYRYSFDNNYYDYHIPSDVKLYNFKKVKIYHDSYDFILNFKIYHENTFKPIVYYKSGGILHKISTSTKNLPKIHHGQATCFSFRILDLVRQKNTKLFLYYNNKYIPLRINLNFNWSGFRNSFKLYIKNNQFYHEI